MLSSFCWDSTIVLFWKSDTNQSPILCKTANMLGHTVSLQVFTTTSNIREDQFIIFPPIVTAVSDSDHRTSPYDNNAPISAMVDVP